MVLFFMQRPTLVSHTGRSCGQQCLRTTDSSITSQLSSHEGSALCACVHARMIQSADSRGVACTYTSIV